MTPPLIAALILFALALFLLVRVERLVRRVERQLATHNIARVVAAVTPDAPRNATRQDETVRQIWRVVSLRVGGWDHLEWVWVDSPAWRRAYDTSSLALIDWRNTMEKGIQADA